MAIRDLFDIVLVLSVAALLSLEVATTSPSLQDPSVLVEFLTGLDVAVYLVFAGVLGLLFVFLITVYIPQKQSRNSAR